MLIIVLVVGVMVLAVSLSLILGNARNRRLDAWAASVPLSMEQSRAMGELWEAHRRGKVPSPDPLAALSQADREYLKTVCSPNFRPAQFGNPTALRLAAFIDLTGRGYTDEQAAVLVGMTFNRVGRPDLRGVTSI
jgi:hypothetical protein